MHFLQKNIKQEWREVQMSVYVEPFSQGPVVISHQRREQGAKSNSFTSPWSACDGCLLALGVERRSASLRRERLTEDKVRFYWINMDPSAPVKSVFQTLTFSSQTVEHTLGILSLHAPGSVHLKELWFQKVTWANICIPTLQTLDVQFLFPNSPLNNPILIT